jgi:PAS domain S-box-containing protein
VKNIHINDQKTSPDILTRPSLITYYTLALLIAWTVIIPASLVWNITEVRSNIIENARIQARTAIEKDIIYRIWNASHGGLYAPVTEKTPPNPYLPDTIERDVITTSGKHMTLINPAYMTRQVFEITKQRSEIMGHITSLKPIRPGNAADPWETKALQSFEQGKKEMSSLQDIKGSEHMRIMLPLITEKPCLKCHAVQGYKEGDIRGGISVSFPMKPFWANAKSQIMTLSFAYFLIWIIGLCGIGAGKMYKNRSDLKRIQAEEALRNSEERFKHVVENAGIWIWEVYANGLYTYSSPVVEQLLGYKPEEIVGKKYFFDFFTPDLREDLKKSAFGVFAKKESFNGFVNPNLHKNGSIVYLETNGTPLLDNNGNLVGYRGSDSDITIRKQTEEELLTEKIKLQSIMSAINSGVTIRNLDYDLIYQNDYSLKLSGNCLGKKCYSAFASIDSVCNDCPVEKAFKDGQSHSIVKKMEIRPGEITFWENIAIPMRDSNGNIYACLELNNNITDFKKTEYALKESEARYIDLYDNAPDMYISVDARTGRILQCNQTLATELGYTKAEIIGREIFYLYHPDSLEKVKKTLRDFVETGEIHDRELQVLRKNGTVIDISLNSSAVRDEEGRILYSRASWRDITDQKELERQLLHSQKMETVGTLAGGVAHDFNNILTVIIGTVSILKRRFPKEDPLQLYFDQIDKAAESAANLTRNLLTFSRKQKNYPTRMEVSEIIRKQEPFLIRVMGEDIEFRKKLADEELFVMVDFNQMEQVFMNLAANARDAMPKGGAFTISTESVIIDDVYRRSHGYGTPGEYALITVSDTGAGIDEYTQARIFEPFFTTKEVDKGTGLGLSLTYGIIKQHNGYIDVRSKLGEGTTFSIYLPLEKNPAKGSDIEKRIESLSHVEVTETILVAEDSAALRNLIAFVLTEAGYKVITAEDGEDALNKFMDNSDSIQLVLLDVIMPKKNGKEASDEIKKIKENIKVLFFSGYSEEVIHQRDIIKEGIEIITKPIKPDVLLRRIRKELDRA